MQSIFEVSDYTLSAEQIVHDVFELMLKYEIAPSPDSYVFSKDLVTAAIFFAGAWQGATLLECSQAQVFSFAARLMGIPAPSTMNEDARDAMGEIINMIGGNLKSVLPAGVGLSMPSVLEGGDYAYKICGAHVKERLSFQGELGPLWLTLVQTDGGPAR